MENHVQHATLEFSIFLMDTTTSSAEPKGLSNLKTKCAPFFSSRSCDFSFQSLAMMSLQLPHHPNLIKNPQNRKSRYHRCVESFFPHFSNEIFPTFSELRFISTKHVEIPEKKYHVINKLRIPSKTEKCFLVAFLFHLARVRASSTV